ncbi:MAG: Hsp20/alpha crystallin family protein [Anaerolineae bacterium]|nr:Hsp20/alpha crystallin family protein [Anaerolineae bacterium]
MNTIVRWNPFREMAAMQSAMDRLFDESWRGVRPTAAGNTLALDVFETDQAYVLFTTLPGVDPQDLHVSMEDDVLTITGEVPQPAFDDKDNARTLMLERSYGKFTRSVRVGMPVDSDKIEAAYENGVLRLTLPKTPQAQPKVIPVRVGAKA